MNEADNKVKTNNARSGFRATGISSFNPQIFLETDFTSRISTDMSREHVLTDNSKQAYTSQMFTTEID